MIGGTGLTQIEGYTPVASVNPLTPWGYASAPIRILEHNGVPIAFLARHGAHHQLAPHEVPARANIAALRHIGVRCVIAFSAVGSLQEHVKPMDFVVPDQVIDRTKGYFPVPAIRQLEGPMLDRVRDALTDPAARRRGLFRADTVQALLNDPNSTRTRLDSNALWQLGLLEMWLQTHGVG